MIIGYQVQDYNGNNWADRPSYEILTEETAIKDLKESREKEPRNCYLMIAILEGDIENPSFEKREESPLGLEGALKELEDNNELKLWEVEIGLFAEDDPNTPFESHNVYVAAEDQDHAMDEARFVAEDNIAVVGRVTFNPCNKPNEVDKADLKSFES